MKFTIFGAFERESYKRYSKLYILMSLNGKKVVWCHTCPAPHIRTLQEIFMHRMRAIMHIVCLIKQNIVSICISSACSFPGIRRARISCAMHNFERPKMCNMEMVMCRNFIKSRPRTYVHFMDKTLDELRK